jgi:hypothetical protein
MVDERGEGDARAQREPVPQRIDPAVVVAGQLVGEVRRRVPSAAPVLVADVLVPSGEGETGWKAGPPTLSWLSMQKSTMGPTVPLLSPFTMVTTGVILMAAACRLSIAIFFTSKRFAMWRCELASLVTPTWFASMKHGLHIMLQRLVRSMVSTAPRPYLIVDVPWRCTS